MKKLFLAITLILAFLLVQTASVSAFSIVGSFDIELDKEFQIYGGQTGILNSENVTVKIDGLYVNDCVGGIGIICPGATSSVNITVTKDYGNISESTELFFGGTGSQEVFDLIITNTGLFSGNDSVAEPDYAKFIVSSTTDETIEVKLDQKFELKESQLALVQKNGETVVKMALNGFTETDRGIYSSLSLSVRNGGQGNIKLLEGEKTQFDNYIFYFHEYDERSNLGVFSVSEMDEKPGDIYVELDRKFELRLQQRAIIKEESLQVFLSGVVETINDCPTGKVCPAGEKQVILDVEFIKTSFASETVSITESTIDTSTVEIIEATKEPVVTGMGTTIFLGEGESRKVFGLKITAIDIGSNSVMLLIEKPDTKPPAYIVELNEKFKLQKGEKVTVVTGSGASKEKIMDLTSNGFIFSSCTYEKSDFDCDERVIAELTASITPNEGQLSEVAILRIKEGEEIAFNGYNIEFAYYNSGIGVFVVRGGSVSNLIKVSLNQKFDLKPNQTALVVNEELYITLDDVQIYKSFPLQKWVVISVWKGIVAEKESTLISQYKMKEGQELELHGFKIQVLRILDSERSATFIVTKEDTRIISVHVNEKFSLKENQGSKVLEANMKIDLLRISTSIICSDQQEGSIVDVPCVERKSVQISVDSYVSRRVRPGVMIDKAIIVKEVISNSVESTTSGSSKTEVTEDQGSIGIIEKPVLVPPTPFEIYILSEGQSIEINDFEITVLYIGSSSADFIVKEKSTGITYTYVIRNGWNLFSMPGEIESEKNNCNSSEWTLYEFNKETNSFVKIRNPTPGKAYWLYNPSSTCEAKVKVRKALELSDLDKLTKGWNFVGVVPEMIGNTINDLGSCDLRVGFRFNASSNKWESIINSRITNSNLGTGFVLYSNNDCSLAGETTIPEIPSLPELPTVD